MSGHVGSAGTSDGYEENLDTAALGERRRRREAERAAERARSGERPLTRREIRARDEAIASGALQLGDVAARHGQTGSVPASSPTPVTPGPGDQAHSYGGSVGSVGSAAAAPGSVGLPSSAAVPTDEEGRPLTRRQLRERAAREEAERQAKLEAEQAEHAQDHEPAPQERPSYSSVQALRSGPFGTPVVPGQPAQPDEAARSTHSTQSAHSAAEPLQSAPEQASPGRPTRSAHSAAAAPSVQSAPAPSTHSAPAVPSAQSAPAPSTHAAAPSVQSAPQPAADDDPDSTQAFLPRWRSVSETGPIARPGATPSAPASAGGPARRPVSSIASASAASVPSAAAPSNTATSAAPSSAPSTAEPSSPPRRVSFRDAELPDPAERRAETAPEHTLRRPVVRPETGEIARGPDPTGSIGRVGETPRRRSVYTASVPTVSGEEDVPVAESTSPVHWHSTASGAIVTADVTPTGAPVPTPSSPSESDSPSPSTSSAGHSNPAASVTSAGSAAENTDDTGPMPPATLDAVVAGEDDDTGEQFLARPEWAAVASVGSAATGAVPTVDAAAGRRASAHSVASATTEGDETSSISDDHEDEPSPRWLTVLQWLVVLAVAVVLGMLVWYVATGGLSGEDQALGTTPIWRMT